MDDAEPGTIVVSAAAAPVPRAALRADARGRRRAPGGVPAGRPGARGGGGRRRPRLRRAPARAGAPAQPAERRACAARARWWRWAARRASASRACVVELRQGLAGQRSSTWRATAFLREAPRPTAASSRCCGRLRDRRDRRPGGERDKVRADVDRPGWTRSRRPYLLHLLGPGEGGEAIAAAEPRGGQVPDVRGPARDDPAARRPRAAGPGRGGPALDRPGVRGVRGVAGRRRRRRARSCSSPPTGPATGRAGSTSPTRRRSRSSRCSARREPEPRPGVSAPPRSTTPHRRDDRRQGRGQPVLPRGAGPGRRARAAADAGRAAVPGHGRGRAHGPDRPAGAPRTSVSCRRRR